MYSNPIQRMKIINCLLLLLMTYISYSQEELHFVKTEENQILTGAEQTEKYLPLLSGKKVGIVANHSSTIKGKSIIDTLLKAGIQIECIFSPEHGFGGDEADGKSIENQTYKNTKIPIISLFGKSLKPDNKIVKKLDCVVFDIQDVGVRFYTYISTMYYMMDACASSGTNFLVLDRPNPNGHFVDGQVLKDSLQSFVGIIPIPIVHGCTVGELAQMINGEKWLTSKKKCPLTVIPCARYSHLNLVQLQNRPSPNLVSMAAIYLYPSLGLFEGTVVSVGRGTTEAFEIIGHPNFCESDTIFTPKPIKGMSDEPPLNGLSCKGIRLKQFGEDYVPYAAQMQIHFIIDAYKCLNRQNIDFFKTYFNKLAGDTKLKDQIKQGLSEEEIRKSWQSDLERYKIIRKKYLLYEDFE